MLSEIMPVQIITITQKHVGTALVKAAKNIFKQLPAPVITISVNYRVEPKQFIEKLRKVLRKIPEHDEVLLLTDLYGSTPSNIAKQLYQICRHDHNAALITGINLPMLLKILNNPERTLDELVKDAVEGGQQGVFLCEC